MPSCWARCRAIPSRGSPRPQSRPRCWIRSPTGDLQKLWLASRPEDQRFLTVQALTGARFIEIARLTRQDCYLEQPVPAVELRSRKRRGGGEKKRVQYLPPMATLVLREQLALGTPHVFPGPYGQQKYRAAKSGWIPPATAPRFGATASTVSAGGPARWPTRWASRHGRWRCSWGILRRSPRSGM